jgi:ribosomal protein S18 acetylase RimI-like enzyme
MFARNAFEDCAVSPPTWLFSYGTLRQSSVQRALFGHEVESFDDVLTGFTVDTVTIADPAVIAKSGTDRHPILRRAAGDQEVRGAALALTEADLEAADLYEADDYARISVVLSSGRKAFVYVARSASRMNEPHNVTYVEPDAALFARLLPVARRIFTDTFAQNYGDAEFQKFCDSVYLPGGSMARDFAASNVRWRVATYDGEPIGYAKLTPLRAPVAEAASGSMELQQIYVSVDWHGTGVAERLIDWGISQARESGAPALYLTVFDHNERAKRFYARYGFEEVGRCTFQLGDRVDDDRIWRRILVRGEASAAAAESQKEASR